MRKCIRCQSEMMENVDIRTVAYGDQLKIIRPETSGILKKSFENIKIAVCPVCGEVSMYIDNPEKFIK